MMIELKNISHHFDRGENILSNINLAMRRGETFVIVGPSGQGKSTLLKVMSGLISPSQGEILIQSKNLYACPRKERVELMNKMGMLFQKNALFDSLTVGENLAFPLRETTDLDETRINFRVKKFLEAVDLLKAENLYPEEISGGMQKRVGIARALALHPEIIFYDDPTAGLDPITSRLIVELLLRLNKEYSVTTVAITNDMNRAYQMADRIGVLMEGRLIITGTVEETKNYPDPRVQSFIRGEWLSDVS